MWKKENEAAGQRLPGSMATYNEAVDEFSKQAAELLAHMPVLTKARDAYQRAMKVSAEIRSMLDARDANLQRLMAQLEEAVAVHSGKTSSDKEKAESVRVEPTQATSEIPDYSRILP
jgi:flagellar biosynthesis chaperone FliJ